jgi:glycerophosphoryl diester phosphodiesterase
MSFSWMSLRRVLEFAPSSRTVYLMDRVPMRYRDGSLPLGAGIAGPSIEIVRAHPEYVDRVHSQGHEVHVWTVNDQADVDLCARVGVDAIITDKPAATLARLQNSLN